ncbi:MAG: hypothetical protein IKW74_04335, partial [Thermoguttaceae bacterium]|nr:hypothetical protein [Thermoguttaceae bacterium]
MKRFTLFLTVCLLTIGIISNTGCKKPKPDEPVPGNDIPASEQNRMLLEQAQKIRSLSPDVLTALGPQNDLPVQWVAPNAYMVQYIQPQRLKQSPAADDIYRFMEALPKTVS